MVHPRARLAIVLLTLLAGCVTVDAVLKADGSGTLEMVYRTPPNTTEAMEKRRFSSGHVKVESLTLKPDGMSTLKVSVDDATKLSTAPGLRDVEATRAKDGDGEKLTVKLNNPNSIDIKDDTKPGPTFTITFPGKVLEANHNAKVSGERVTWTFGLREYLKARSTELVARYVVPAAGAETAPPKAQPEPAK